MLVLCGIGFYFEVFMDGTVKRVFLDCLESGDECI